jgi:thiosulfate/3-mercaptopyruvate sulfurtransferase
MTHPAQARDALAQRGFSNAYLLTDGLAGFVDRCLKPVSLRDEPLSAELASRVRAWRAFFLNEKSVLAQTATTAQTVDAPLGNAMVSIKWLAENQSDPAVVVLDVRPGPEYSTAHIPGSLRIAMENLRTTVGGVHSMLMPPEMIATQLSLLGITADQHVVLVAGAKFRDATYVGLALDRVGHARWSILEGGYEAWLADGRPVDANLPEVSASTYTPPSSTSGLMVDYRVVRAALGKNLPVVLDTRPADYFAGAKSDEARAGHIPGAVGRSYSEDLDEQGQLKPVSELAAVYEKLLPAKEAPIIVHCRTGHQASQTYFVLRHLLGYRDVTFYDGGWTEWAAHPELPAEGA